MLRYALIILSTFRRFDFIGLFTIKRVNSVLFLPVSYFAQNSNTGHLSFYTFEYNLCSLHIGTQNQFYSFENYLNDENSFSSPLFFHCQQMCIFLYTKTLSTDPRQKAYELRKFTSINRRSSIIPYLELLVQRILVTQHFLCVLRIDRLLGFFDRFCIQLPHDNFYQQTSAYRVFINIHQLFMYLHSCLTLNHQKQETDSPHYIRFYSY